MFDVDTLVVNGQTVTVEDHAEGFYRVTDAPKCPSVWRGVFTQLREVWPVRVDAATANWLHANWFREPGMYRVG